MDVVEELVGPPGVGPDAEYIPFYLGDRPELHMEHILQLEVGHIHLVGQFLADETLHREPGQTCLFHNPVVIVVALGVEPYLILVHYYKFATQKVGDFLLRGTCQIRIGRHSGLVALLEDYLEC